jgi:hypothetical protein
MIFGDVLDIIYLLISMTVAAGYLINRETLRMSEKNLAISRNLIVCLNSNLFEI